MTIIDATEDLGLHPDQSDGHDSAGELLDDALSRCGCAEVSPPQQIGGGWATRGQRLGFFCGRSESGSIKNDTLVRERVRKSVMRFRRENDRYMALGSLLLKSRTYHQLAGVEGKTARRLPVVELPRTEHGKPYIPVDPQDLENKTDEEGCGMLSVSHQYPFVAIVQLRPPCLHQSVDKFTVGLDVVVFEPPNPRLYKSSQPVDEFLSAFKDSFTPREMVRINNSRSADKKLREFYLRWSVKESYTKALGVGLGYDFGGFDTRLHGVDDAENCCSDGAKTSVLGDSGLWDHLVAAIREGKTVLQMYGTVIHHCDPKKQDELWEFLFVPLPLRSYGSSLTPSSIAPSEALSCGGCACIGINRVALDRHATQVQPWKESSMTKIDTIPTTIRDVVRWHEEGGKEYIKR